MWNAVAMEAGEPLLEVVDTRQDMEMQHKTHRVSPTARKVHILYE